MRKLILAFLLIFCASRSYGQVNPAPFRCQSQKHIIQLSMNNTGQTVEGPACAEMEIDALRYGADFGKTITYSNGPNLTSIFPASFSPGGADPKTVVAQSLEDKFKGDDDQWRALSNQLILLEGTNRTTAANLDRYLSSLRNLIVQTDDTMANSGPTGVMAIVNDPANKAQMDAALGSLVNWNTTDAIVTRLQQLQADLTSLPLQFPSNTGTVTGDPCSSANIKLLGWTDWSKCRDTQYKLAQSSVTALSTEASSWTSDGDKASQFAKKIGIVQYWKTTFTALSPDSFKKQAEVQCSVLFNRNEQTVLKLVLTDRTAVFDGQTAQPQTKDNLLTVTCSSPFSISAGAAFGTMQNPQFAIVKSAPAAGGTTSINTFGITSNSQINPYPIAMANGRLYSWSHNRYALHFSFGVGASVSGQNSTGSSPEFLTGLSLSLFRTIYITGGLNVAKQTQLIGGFMVGGTVPSDVTAPPTSSSYRPGFGFAITFTKP
jgi:hypothetical protein